MGQEEFDARAAAGEDEYGLVAEDLRRRGYQFNALEQRWVQPEVVALRELLDQAVEWARRPSPVPIVPFQEFIELTKAARGVPARNEAVEIWKRHLASYEITE